MRLSYLAVVWLTSTILGSSASCATGVPIDPESSDWGGHTDSGAGGRLSGSSQGGGPQDSSTVPEGGGQDTGGGDAESTDGSASSDGDASTGSVGIGATGGSGASARTDVADGSGGCGADGGYGQTENSNALCSDGIDNDCDGTFDCDDDFCCNSGVPATGVTVCHPGTCGGGTGGAGGGEGMSGTGGSDDGSCHVVINEVQVSGTGSPADEWVELHNPCSHDVVLEGWKLVYRSAQGTSDMLLHSWTDLSLLHAGGYRVIGGKGYSGLKDDVMNGGSTGSISGSGGGIGLQDSTAIVDSVGYGTATNAFVEGQPAVVPSAGNSVARSPDGRDTDDNSLDFKEESAPTPGAGNL